MARRNYCEKMDTNEIPAKMMQMNSLNIMTWNCRGFHSSVPYLLSCLEGYAIEICGLSEHQLREYNLFLLATISENYTVYGKCYGYGYDGSCVRLPARAGVALMVAKKPGFLRK